MSQRAPERLADIGWLKAEPLRSVLALLNRGGIETRVVGGAVRNALLELPRGDVDLATTALPDEVQRLVREAGIKAVPTGVAHGTVTVVADGRAFEVTTLRHDVETHGRHATVAFGADWQADAARRDFTINALYADAEGHLHDPLGGYPDILARRVRFIGDPLERIREDYLRILRFFRFHAEYGVGAPDRGGLAAVIAERNGLLGLSKERIRGELLRLVAAPGAAASVESMDEAGLLVMLLGGVCYRAAFVRLGSIEAELASRPDPIMRLAALAVVIEEDAGRLAGRLRLSNEERDRLVLATRGWRDLSPVLSGPERRACLYRLGREAYVDGTLLGWARSGDPVDDGRWRNLLSLPDRWSAPRFPLKGADLLALGARKGPELGRRLAELEAQWIAGDFSDDRQALLERARMFSG